MTDHYKTVSQNSMDFGANIETKVIDDLIDDSKPNLMIISDVQELVRDVEIELGNPSNGWSFSDSYTYHYHIIQLFLVTLILFIARYFNQIANIVISIICLVWSIVIFCIAFYYYYLKKMNDDNNNNKHKKTFLNCINIILGISDTSTTINIYNINRKLYGLIFLSACFHTSFMYLIYSSNYYVVGGVVVMECPDNQPEQCMVFRAVDTSIHVLLFIGFSLTLTAHHEVTSKCHNKIKDGYNTILSKYNYSKSIQLLFRRITNIALVKWDNNKRLKNRVLECTVGFMLSAFAVIGLMGSFDGGIWTQQEYSSKYISTYVFVLYINIIDTIFCFIFFIYMAHTLLHHYKFAAIIMKEFSLPIQCESIDDLFAWWELRKYYKCCVVKIYSAGFSSIIFIILCIFLGISIAIFSILLSDSDNTSTSYIIFYTVILLYAAISSFYLVGWAVAYHGNQLSHSITLNKERLKFKKQHYMKILDSLDENTNQSQMNVIQEAIDIIDFDVKKNSTTIKCIGISMNYNFILFLRATVVSIVVAYAIKRF